MIHGRGKVFWQHHICNHKGPFSGLTTLVLQFDLFWSRFWFYNLVAKIWSIRICLDYTFAQFKPALFLATQIWLVTFRVLVLQLNRKNMICRYMSELHLYNISALYHDPIEGKSISTKPHLQPKSPFVTSSYSMGIPILLD